jgi:hypothetical protein
MVNEMMREMPAHNPALSPESDSSKKPLAKNTVKKLKMSVGLNISGNSRPENISLNKINKNVNPPNIINPYK